MKPALMLAVVAAALSGCRSDSPRLPGMPPPDRPPHFESKADPASPWKLSGALVPPEPMVNVPQRVLLTIADAQGKPVREASIIGRPHMPLMGHGDGEFTLTRGPGEIWTGTTTLNMAGDWEIEVTINAADQTAKHTFSFVVREMPQ